MWQRLSVKHREQTRVASQKSEESPWVVTPRGQKREWTQQKEVPGLPAFTVCFFGILCGPIPSQSTDCSG